MPSSPSGQQYPFLTKVLNLISLLPRTLHNDLHKGKVLSLPHKLPTSDVWLGGWRQLNTSCHNTALSSFSVKIQVTLAGAIRQPTLSYRRADLLLSNASYSMAHPNHSLPTSIPPSCLGLVTAQGCCHILHPHCFLSPTNTWLPI